LKKYFTRTFRNSQYGLSQQDFDFLTDRLDENHAYASGVSDHLITRFNKVQVLFIMVCLMVLTLLAERLCVRTLNR
jgi:hypothetical protein